MASALITTTASIGRNGENREAGFFSAGKDAPRLRLFAPPVVDPAADGAATWSADGWAPPDPLSDFPRSADSRGGLSPAMRLSEFFAAHAMPSYLVAGDAAPRNVDQYAESVRLWARATGDPPLAAIDGQTCDRFLAWLRARPGRRGGTLSPNTVLKHRVAVQKILDLAGPRSRSNPRAAARHGLFGDDDDGLPREAPLIMRPKKQSHAPSGGWTLREIGQWMDAAAAWTKPALVGIEPGVFWVETTRFLFNTALRRETAVTVRRDMIHRGWLTVPAALMKGGRRDHEIWLNRHAREAVERLTTADGRIVPWPHGLNYLSQCVADQVEAWCPPERRAQIDKPLHALRARCLTILWSRDSGVSKHVAGHVGGDVTLSHYVGRSAMRRELDRLPQPKRTSHGYLEGQRMLF
jgi:hypothetical protein